jgi:preprotein translocase subunit SecG
MAAVISILVILASLFLVLIVLIQNPKGGGMSSAFGSATQFGGVRKTTDFLEKATWGLAIAILALSIFSAPFADKTRVVKSDDTEIYKNPVGGSGGSNVQLPQ